MPRSHKHTSDPGDPSRPSTPTEQDIIGLLLRIKDGTNDSLQWLTALEERLRASHKTKPNIPADLFKPRDLATFWPPEEHENAAIGGVFYDRDWHSLVFTDVDCFVGHINTFLYNPTTADQNEQKILSMIHLTFVGLATEWWEKELSEEARHQLQAGNMDTILLALKQRFGHQRQSNASGGGDKKSSTGR